MRVIAYGAAIVLLVAGLALAFGGCATTKDGMALMAETLKQWQGNVELTSPARIKAGVGLEYYAEVELSGVEAAGSAAGDTGKAE